MGATNDIKETNISGQLENKECSHCSQKFTEQDLNERNWDIYFDTSNDVKLEPLEKGYQLSIWIRSIEHESCPQTETCQNCWDKFLEKNMKKFKDNYYCLPCYQLIDKDHE